MDQKLRNWLFFQFFNTNVSDFVSNINNDCSQLSFEVYNVFVAQKLQILEIFIDYLSSGPWPLWRPPEVAISTSATSTGCQILAEYHSFYMWHCLLVWNEIGEALYYVFPKWVDSPSPHVFNWPKSPRLLGFVQFIISSYFPPL